MAWYQILILIVASLLAGAVNSVAGGGTLLSFPALIFAGQGARIANATNTVALWPGALSSFWGYRSELGDHRREIALLSVPSVLGGLLGAWLMVKTDETTFAFLVPYLILLATGLFVVQEPLSRLQRRLSAHPKNLPSPSGRVAEKLHSPSGRAADELPSPSGRGAGGEGLHAAAPNATNAPSGPSFAHNATPLRWCVVLGSQFLVGVYGGYFGAGIGILMLAAYGILGFSNIHQANAIKNLNAMFINGIAAVLFVARGFVDWRLASIMAVGAIIGGYAGAGAARRLGQKNVRRLVIIIGLAMAVAMFFKST